MPAPKEGGGLNLQRFRLLGRALFPLLHSVPVHRLSQRVPSACRVRREVRPGRGAVFLVRLAGIGKIAFLDRELFEYRVHSGQDSKELREDLYRMKEALLVECSKDDPRYSRKVRRTVAENQTRRWMERTVSALLVHRSLKKASVQLFTTRPEQLDYAGMLRTILCRPATSKGSSGAGRASDDLSCRAARTGRISTSS